METKIHDFADHDIKEHEKIDDDKTHKSVEESESTEEVNKDVARKNTNRIHKTISEEGKKIILDYMKDWIKGGRKPSNPFKILAKKLKDSCDQDYYSKAICDYYWNKLDPQLDHSPYSPEEKNYICEWASKFQENDNIQWKKLQPKVQTKFGKSRSRNSLKNVWCSNKRRTDRLAKEVKRDEVNMIEEDTIEGKNEIKDEGVISEIEDKKEIKSEDEIKVIGEIKNKNEIEGVPEKMYQLFNEPGTSTKQEKLELRYLLNDEDENDKNDNMDLN
ncbi:unnamed protein product [Rhizophagus irregularis]|uniref:Myb-like domain-containing protein n=1 Tax=Rhizophagus irregularis TaxID=588596 RepID=A0A2N1N2G4_9GLOM|nr:hypothetical protein RhiirC2_867497 [Rhizophagus irregularis]CAB4383664.1 unnamed protein product [Rhizophagus irregularis]CAB5353208.1 unnamed protein product [Rhizophagus irregularis]